MKFSVHYHSIGVRGILVLSLAAAVGVTSHLAAEAVGRASDAADVTEAQAVQSEVPAGAVINTTGSGTTGHLARWTSPQALGDSVLIQNSAKNVGIGDPNPSSKLTVSAGKVDFATIRGTNTSAGNGVSGISTAGVGVVGTTKAQTSTAGVRTEVAISQVVAGVLGIVSNTAAVPAAAVRGIHEGSGASSIGVYGSTNGGGYGVVGEVPSGVGVYGESNTGAGVAGKSGTQSGVAGESTSGKGVQGVSDSGTGVYGQSSSGNAGLFLGDVSVTGTLSKGAGSFKIDHPVDPAHKYLSHSFVESPDMMNIYNGNVRLDRKGNATVEMPEYFSALNQEFRYQLTAIEAPGPNLYVAQQIKGNRFKISGGKAGMQVSWMVTGIRHDAFANAHRIAVETEKSGTEVGHYLQPEAFGRPPSEGIAAIAEPAGSLGPEKLAAK